MSELPNTVHQGESQFARPETFIWREPDHRSPARTCGYCGSLHPEDFATAEVAQNGRIELADMKYGWPHKAYIDLANPDPGLLSVLGATTRLREDDRGYKRREDLNEEEIAALKRDRWEEESFEGFMFGTRSSLHGKFYLIHLLEPELDPEVKDACERRIGLRLFHGGRPGTVRWEPVAYTQ